MSEERTHKPRIMIDCTDTYRRGTRTGIQRVVRNLVSHGTRIDAACRAVIFGGAASKSRQWYGVNWDPACAGSAAFPPPRLASGKEPGLAAAFKRSALRMARGLRAAAKPLQIGELALDWFRRRRLDASYEAVDWTPGDILLLPEVMWGYHTMPDYAGLRARGVKIILLVHDLIPIAFPRFVHPMSARWFQQWLDATVPHVDGIVTVSRTVRDTVRKYVQERFPQSGLDADRIQSFAMGVALDECRSNGEVRDTLRGADGAYLAVSTLEPRKNHTLLLDAFERVWQRFPEARLCIVGQEGWLVEDLVTRIRQHPKLGRQLLWFDDLTDTELAWIYGHAKALLFPSLAEGYGLPIVEALLHGLPVLASDTLIHREVAGEFGVYFDPAAPGSLAGLIEAWEDGTPVRPAKDPADHRATTWEESVRGLLAQCRKIAQRSRLEAR